ncbi:hypothetical protein [Kitasatospora sp. LaBMicrA B282]|uniref:VMAP-C domain-containing protein n=1 Tax=Kitasatospora sp. LaBMicrA B282 TaxID=3420949 RepID=UPI003D0A042A
MAEVPPGVGGQAGQPWSTAGEALLLTVLLGVDGMTRLQVRHDLVSALGRRSATWGLDAHVPEEPAADPHLRKLLHTLGSHRDPFAALRTLSEVLRELHPHDRSAGWLEPVRLALAPDAVLPETELLPVLAELRSRPTAALPDAQLPRDTAGLGLLTGQEILPDLLARLLDTRERPRAAPLLDFLTALVGDLDPTARGDLPEVHRLLRRHRAQPGPPPDAVATATRLIIQIRLESESPEHLEADRFRVQAGYYHQALDGGPLERLGWRSRAHSLTRAELVEAGSAWLADWPELTGALRRAAGGPVRIEFLLPHALFGHAGELWCPGTAAQPLGRSHPVVIRSLERYLDAWLDRADWRQRWAELRAWLQCPPGGPAVEPEPPETVLSGIGWPALAGEHAPDLADWLADRPGLACLGLEIPYDELAPGARKDLDDALFLDGVPVLVWRRTPGHRAELVAALGRHRPRHLAELPETVHLFRKRQRGADATRPEAGITLLWDDPDCVDPVPDEPFPGMT